MKAISSICGPNDDVIIPKGSVKTDYEVELGIVIGTKASYIAVHDAPKHIAGYCVVNDVSEREFQIERGGQWTKGKSADTFCPMGPWLVTADEVPNPGALQLWTEVNGERRQNSNTSDLIFGIDHIVSYVSHFMTLMPGDVIPTGTPSGVGLGFKPPRFLKPGDRDAPVGRGSRRAGAAPGRLRGLTARGALLGSTRSWRDDPARRRTVRCRGSAGTRSAGTSRAAHLGASAMRRFRAMVARSRACRILPNV